MSDHTAVTLTQELVRFPTINPPGNESACAAYVGGILAGAGFRVTYREFDAERTSLVARIDGHEPGPPLCFTGHLDTVPLGAARWTRDPLRGEIGEGRLWGRGSSDMKSGVAAFVTAAVRVARQRLPKAGLVLVITAGEETGCTGAADLARQPGMLGQAGAMIVAEPTSNYPCVGHKGALRLDAITRGITAHGSMPEQGDNAVYTMARAIPRLEAFDFGVPAHRVLGRPTLNVGTIHGGLNINSVPDECVAGIDIRTIPGQSHEGLMSALSTCVGPDVELVSTRWVTGVWTEPATAWVQDVFDIMAPLLGERPDARALPYFTDGSILAEAYGGAPTVILGPGEAAQAHQTDEYCLVERIEQAAEAYTRIAQRWCGL
jgi:succinyl-diaminopimelate desuccinylase